MPRMLFTAFALICSPANAAVLTFSCDGTMKEEAQRKAHAITNMRLIVNSDAGVVIGFTGITARIDEVNAKSDRLRHSALAIKLVAFGELAFIKGVYS
jgi:hypothetical protein